MSDIDYLIVGHVCKDLTPGGPRLGGTVTFGALTANVLGLRVGVVTSAPDSMQSLLAPLRVVNMECVPSDHPTTFENVYTRAGRLQSISSRATPLTLDHIPAKWRRASIVHLAPVADEVAPSLAWSFPGALIGVTPQGWMRQWDSAGRVSYCRWPDATSVLRHASATVLSIEDVQGDETLVQEYARQAAILVVTRGAQGCTLFVRGQMYHLPAPQVNEVDPTGAGDIFAAAFFAHLRATSDPVAAARFATLLASDSVTRSGQDSIPSAPTAAAILAGFGTCTETGGPDV